MSIKLLPDNFDKLLSQAVQLFWSTRSNGGTSQEGTRSNVIAGKNLDGFLTVVEAIAEHCGLPRTSLHTSSRKLLTLPGYYRPVKNWDVVIVDRQRLIAVLEFKSMVGSFGNNFNNRSEEAIGNAADMLAAAASGAYHPSHHKGHQPGRHLPDPRPPFIGYLMLLQDAEGSRRPVKTSSAHYHLFKEFDGASYSDRYRILCERLMKQNLYSAASLMLSEQSDGQSPGIWRSLSPATDVRNLFSQLAGRLLAANQG